MKCALSCVFALLVATSAVKDPTPVEKVVQLLTELKNTLVDEGKSEQQLYDKTACWCDKATHKKADAIEQAQMDIRSLGQDILRLKGRIATLSQEIKDDMKNIKDGVDAQETAAAIRLKENTEYMDDAATTKQAMKALGKAIKVLQAGTKDNALMQTDATKSTVKRLIEMLPPHADIKEHQLVTLEEFAEGKAEYAPQSQTVQGILTDMFETYASDLESATDVEATKSKNFEDFYASQEKQNNEFKKSQAAHGQSKSDAEVALSQAQQSFDDTNAQLKADIKFFDETKAYCSEKHTEFRARVNARSQEEDGIDKAIAMLSSDEARELFHSAIKPGKEVKTGDFDTQVDIQGDKYASFLQIEDESSMRVTVMRAFTALKEQSQKTHSFRLARLAGTVRTAKLGHFKEVIKQIDEMIDVLNDEEKADTEKRDECKEEYRKIASTSEDLKWKIKKNEAKEDKLQKNIEDLSEQRREAMLDIKNVEDDQTEMKFQRNQEHDAFDAAKVEDTKAIELLSAARDSLTKYYDDHKIEMGKIQGSVKGAFLQIFQPEDEEYKKSWTSPPPPEFEKGEFERPDAEFADKGAHKNKAKGIVSIMTMIIEDLNDEIKNGLKTEAAAHEDYVNRMAAADQLKQELTDKKTSLEEAISDRQSDLQDETNTKTENNNDLTTEQNYKAKITNDCDFAINTFQQRLKQRAAERHGLFKAKEFLASGNVQSGNHDEAVTDSFLQKPFMAEVRKSGFMMK